MKWSLKKDKEDCYNKLENLNIENVNLKITMNDNLNTIKNNKEIIQKYFIHMFYVLFLMLCDVWC